MTILDPDTTSRVVSFVPGQTLAGPPRPGAADRRTVPVGPPHRLLLHATEDERLEQLAEWMADGVADGHMLLHLEVADDPAGHLVAALQQRLVRQRGPAAAGVLTRARERGQLVVFGLSPEALGEGGPGAGRPDARIMAALDGGWEGVRLSSQSCRAARTVGSSVYAEAERRLDGLTRHWPVTALCQVHRGDLHEPTVSLALALHPHQVGDGLVDLTATEHQVVIAGEADVSNAELVHHVVDRWARHEASVMSLALPDLRFIDTTAGEAMLRACVPLLDRDGTVQIRGAQRPVLRVLRLIGMHPHIEVPPAA